MNSVMNLTAMMPGDADAPLREQQAEARRLARSAAWVLALGLAPVLAWMVLAPLSSAVVATAFVKVDLDRRPVQHAEGGTVREVLVRDGQRVKEGEALLVLGDVSVDADMNRLSYRVAALRASIARLEAEQALAAAIAWPADLLRSAASDPRVDEQIAKEKALFAARRLALSGQTALLRGQREMVMQERESLRQQIVQAGESLRHQKTELELNRRLQKDGYISVTRVTQLEATVSDYGVKSEEKRSDLARAEQRLFDTDLRIKSLESDYRQQASDKLKETNSSLSEIEQELRKSSDASKRQVIVAPTAGDVMNLKFTSQGAVVSPREAIADIVPADPRLLIEAHIRTEDVSRVGLGQAAEIRFNAFKYRTTRLVEGKVFYVSPDRLVDRVTNQPYYVAMVEADPASLARAEDVKLLAGMPADVYIKGETRTPLQYLVEPITQLLRHAGRER